VLLGIGAGWNTEELAHHGVDPARRFGVMREYVAALQTIWTEDVASFAGAYARFGPIHSWPKPRQQPHPPIIVGGEGPRVFDRVLAYGDEWGPNAEPGLEQRAAELRRRAAERGRWTIPITAFHVRPEPAVLCSYARAGVTRVVFTLPNGPLDEVQLALVQLAELVHNVGPLPPRSCPASEAADAGA
jgi:alkanesulfonate monooxygenase SsuD/methylene tetrahydromethanopterin reductase-like flavin-dependent oxidoreductase (luciferase family)